MKAIQGMLTSSILFLGAVILCLCAQKSDAQAATGICPRITATAYAAGDGSVLRGNHYTVMTATVECAQASAWIKKIVAQRLSGPPDEDMKVKGPAGYACTASLDNQGHPYQGHCQKNGDENTGFQWTMGG